MSGQPGSTVIQTVPIKGLDATILLAESLVPYSLVAGRIERFAQVNSMLPHGPMRALEDRMAAAERRPYIVPDAITIDNGKEFKSSNFELACAAFGTSVNWCAPRIAWGKGVVERQFRTINEQFCSLFTSYLGPNVTERGTPDSVQPRVTLDMVRELFDEWVLLYWQNRCHDSLHDPSSPRVKLTPNQMYEASLRYSPVFPMPITTEILYRLYPVRWQKIEHYGVQVNSIRYDCAELNPLRYRESGVVAHNNRWEVRYNPHFPTCVWVHEPRADEWITAFAKRLREYDVPFADAMWSPPDDGVLDEQIVRAREVALDDIRRRAQGSDALSDRRSAALADYEKRVESSGLDRPEQHVLDAHADSAPDGGDADDGDHDSAPPPNAEGFSPWSL